MARKITRRRLKEWTAQNNSPKGWTDGKLNDQLENNSRNRWTGAELSERLENESPNEWPDGEFNGRLKNNSPKTWTDGELKGFTSKITHQGKFKCSARK